MSIVATEVESIHGAENQKRLIFYKCQDHLGSWHSYGPVVTVDPNFDVNGFKVIVSDRITERLAAEEFEKLINEV